MVKVALAEVERAQVRPAAELETAAQGILAASTRTCCPIHSAGPDPRLSGAATTGSTAPGRSNVRKGLQRHFRVAASVLGRHGHGYAGLV